MAWQRTRVKNGRTYTYWVEAYRDALGRPRQRHLGKNWLPQPIPQEERGLAVIERLMKEYPETPSTNAPQQGQDDAAPASPGSPDVPDTSKQ